MADNRTMAQMLQAPIEGYEDAIVVPPINANNLRENKTLIIIFDFSTKSLLRLLRQCPHHGFSELHQLDTFYNSLNTNDQDALDSAAGGNFLDKMPRDGLAIIESKSKVRYSRSRAIEPRVSTNAPLSTSTPFNSFEFQQLAASFEDKMDIRMSRLEKMISEKNVTTPATIKAVEEVCVTCGANHNFNNYPLTRNEFPVFHDNIHQFQQTAAVGNFVQRNPPNLANQMRPPGFNQPNVQNNQGNQNRYQGNNFNSNQNREGNFNQNRQNNQGAVYQAPPYQPPMNQLPVYQAPTQQIQGVSKTDFENYVKVNDAVLKNVQNQGQNLQNQMANLQVLLISSLHNIQNSASTSNSGTLLSQTEPEQNPETSMDKVQKPSSESTAQVPPPEEEDSIFIEIPKPKAKKTVNVEIQDLNSPRPNSYQPKLPYPERMKVRENDKPIATNGLSSLSTEQREFRESAIKTVNAECSAIIMNKVPEMLEDSGKFLIPCALQDLDNSGVPNYSREDLSFAQQNSHDIYEEKLTYKNDPFSGSTTIPSDAPFPSFSPMKTSDSTFKEFIDEFPLPNSLPPGNDVSIHKKDIHEETFSNPLFEFDDNFKSSNVNPLFNDMDVEIKSLSSIPLTFT
ncbi:hypothetical protein Tco_0500897 [Tanacetum coccineum]